MILFLQKKKRERERGKERKTIDSHNPWQTEEKSGLDTGNLFSVFQGHIPNYCYILPKPRLKLYLYLP